MKDIGNRFWSLLEPEHSRVEAFCRRLAGNRDDGDDLYQEALLAAMQKFDTLRDESAFRPWLYRIVVNKHRNRCRQPWWRRLVNLTRETIDQQQAGDPSELSAAKRWLQRAYRALTAEEQAMVTLFELEGWSIAELSNLFGKPEGTIKAKLFRARRKMREEIDRYFPKDETTFVSSEAEYAIPQKKPSRE